MKVKDGVVTYGLAFEMRVVLMEADEIWKQHGHELVLTEGVAKFDSGVKGRLEWSLHPFGRAVDLRTYYFDSVEIVLHVAQQLKNALGNAYDVKVEVNPPHIHVEYDPPNPLWSKEL